MFQEDLPAERAIVKLTELVLSVHEVLGSILSIITHKVLRWKEVCEINFGLIHQRSTYVLLP